MYKLPEMGRGRGEWRGNSGNARKKTFFFFRRCSLIQTWYFKVAFTHQPQIGASRQKVAHLSKDCLKLGESHVLCLFLSPSPQLLEHELHGAHSLQNGQKCWNIDSETRPAASNCHDLHAHIVAGLLLLALPLAKPARLPIVTSRLWSCALPGRKCDINDDSRQWQY